LKIAIKEYKLGNGLKCIFYQNNKTPIVNIAVGYEVGSRYEKDGQKGIAHLFEHMMFQGSENVKKNQHFEIVQKCGGYCNAFTHNDFTIFHTRVTSNHLETILWLESERMNNLNIDETNLENQKNVVIEEKLSHYDNLPYGTAMSNILSNIFKGTPYQTPIIGIKEDIENITVDIAKEFYNTYYTPNRAAIAISGDIDVDKCIEKVEKYFGWINKKNSKVEELNFEVNCNKFKPKIVKDNVSLVALYLAFPIPPAGSREEYIWEYFVNSIANTKSSRLFKNLVYKKKYANSLFVLDYMLMKGGVMVINVLANQGIDIKLIEKEIFSEIDKLVNEGLTSKEFNTIRNKIEFTHLTKLYLVQYVNLSILTNWLMFRKPELINEEIEKYLSVTPDEILNAVKKYIRKECMFKLIYEPK
jgi:predicted Zn-dependent peptidase